MATLISYITGHIYIAVGFGAFIAIIWAYLKGKKNAKTKQENERAKAIEKSRKRLDAANRRNHITRNDKLRHKKYYRD